MIYLNNAASSFPKPEAVHRALQECLRNPPFPASRTGYDTQREHVVFECREALAELFHAPSPRNIVFSSGATESLCLAIFGLRLNKAAHVVSTTIEHNSVLRPLKTLERDGAIELELIDCDASGYIDPGRLCERITSNTKAVIVNHCSNVTGAVTDLQPIGAATTKSGIPFIVDASQSAGSLSIDVEAMQIDLLAFTGHKALYGLPGIGGLFIRDHIELTPLKIGGTGSRSDLLYQPEGLPDYYEAGTPNLPGIASLRAGLAFIREKSAEQIQAHKKELVQRMMTELAAMKSVTLYPAEFHDDAPQLFSFNIRNMPPADVGYILENSFGIITRAGLHCAPLIHRALGSYPEGSVRVSPSWFTTDQEVDSFLEAVEAITEVTG